MKINFTLKINKKKISNDLPLVGRLFRVFGPPANIFQKFINLFWFVNVAVVVVVVVVVVIVTHLN